LGCPEILTIPYEYLKMAVLKNNVKIVDISNWATQIKQRYAEKTAQQLWLLAISGESRYKTAKSPEKYWMMPITLLNN
jgi:hypothetical protein